uniref:Uncharacterized protein n=1 Tax=Marmota marmota marmota TaxID=9994 RepID=A0A8C5Z092_MARMA
MLRISHCESTFTIPTGGSSGLVHYKHLPTHTPLRSHNSPPPFHSHISPLLLTEIESPPFFLHIDVTILVAYAHQLSIDLYILSMFFSMYKSSFKFIASLW